MHSYILPFRPWIVAAACMLLIEGWVSYAYNPSPASRSNFGPYDISNQFQLASHDEIINAKLEMVPSRAPTIIQVGDSSGFFSIIPEVVERYLPNEVFFNSSCCAIQGYNGYLALLRFQLERLPTIKYMIVHAGMQGAFPGPIQWREAPATLNAGGGDIATVGRRMENTFLAPWRYLNVPSNGLRHDVLDATFLSAAFRDQLRHPKGFMETI